MALSVNIKANSEYLQVNVTGQYNMDEAVERFPKVVAACRRYHLDKVLIDYRTLKGEQAMVQEIMSAMRIGDFYSQHLATHGTPLKIAFVGNASFIRTWTPGTDVAERYGLEAFMTTKLNEAIEWLTS